MFQSFRRLPSQLAGMRKKTDSIEVVGSHYKVNVCSNLGFPAKPSSIAYDQALNIFAVATRDGLLYVYGKPGVVFSGIHANSSEIIKVIFITGTGKLLTLSDTDDIYIWELDSIDAVHPCVKNICQFSNILNALEPKRVDLGEKSMAEVSKVISHITALTVSATNTTIFFGTDQGCVASIRRTVQTKKVIAQPENTLWTLPTYNVTITPQRILQSIPQEKRARLRLDAVVILSERPGFIGQLLIGYISGLSLIYDLLGDRVLALLPWQYGLESTTWCGGSGLPIRNSAANPTVCPPQLGTRLLTAHADGSLGVWQVPIFGTAPGTDHVDAQILSMKEAPSMPYGPFPCKLIGKVFWLPSHKGGITIFSGGMPRSTYGSRHTVSILRGSNLDQAAAANLAAAFRRAASGDDEDGGRLTGNYEEDEEEEYEDEENQHLSSGLVPGAPAHVFDADAPEHICLDLPSNLVDVCPLGPAGGPASGLLILCEEEMIAIDLLTSGWPMFSLPYLSCLHTSSISAYSLFTQVNPQFLTNLDRVSGMVGKGDANGLGRPDSGYSKRAWPVQGGQCCVPITNNIAASSSPVRPHAATLPHQHISVDPARSLITSNDLLVTGHENGTAGFWRLGPGGCARKVFTLFTGSLFDGDFGPDAMGDANGETGEEESDPWPPFRRVGLFDPFMDDVRAAIKSIKLIDNTLVIGGVAGQVTTWQFANTKPPILKVDVPIAPEIPGFRWKGHASLKLREQQNLSEDERPSSISLYPVGVALVQPPAQITDLAICELTPASAMVNNNSNQHVGCLVGIGTPHGFGVVHFPGSPQMPTSSETAVEGVQMATQVADVLLAHSTIPANLEALEEAAVGEGWARRRTRELKNSLRDSFRRLKRMRSTTSPPTNSTSNTAPQAATSSSSTISRPNFASRVGLRKSVTMSNPTQSRTDPLQEAILRTRSKSGLGGSGGKADVVPIGGEREIRDRPAETANTATVRCVTFGPPVHRIRPPSSATPCPLGSFFAGTAGGTMMAYALFANSPANSVPNALTRLAVRHASELQLQHRAPIIHLRLIDTKSYTPLSPNSVFSPNHNVLQPNQNSLQHQHAPPPPHLVVMSEEQVRLFSLPAIQLRQKARITAKDGFRIKTGSIIGFQQTNEIGQTGGSGLMLRSGYGGGPEFGCVFTNNGGQTVVLSMPHLRKRDAMALMSPQDLLQMNSFVFAENASLLSGVPAPSLGLYQLAPGQLTMFDVVLTGQKSSVLGSAYRALHRVKPASRLTNPASSPENGTNRSPPISHPPHALASAADNCPRTSSTPNSRLGNLAH